MDKNIVFLGIKHCGKSTQGQLLSARLGRQFLDTDEMLSQSYMREYGSSCGESSPREIMKRHGEEFFRRFEAETIRSYQQKAQPEPVVMALGGGVPCNEFLSTAELKKLGVLVYLAIDVDTAFRRIISHGVPPFLHSSDPYSKFTAIYEKRSPRYCELADITIAVPPDPVKSKLNDDIYNTLIKNKVLKAI